MNRKFEQWTPQVVDKGQRNMSVALNIIPYVYFRSCSNKEKAFIPGIVWNCCRAREGMLFGLAKERGTSRQVRSG